MTLPKEAELLGSSSGELEIKGSGVSTVVTLSAEGERKLSILISGTNAKSSSVYLGLERVLGTFDAAVLNVYINLPENSPAADHHNLLAESIGLYGMRMASTAQGEKASQGLTFIVEITAILTELRASKSLNLKEIRVSLLPDRPLPDSITIAIGRLSIFAMSAS